MPPKGRPMKRAAHKASPRKSSAGVSPSPSKRARHHCPPAAAIRGCGKVAAALADAEDLPESVRNLLSAKLPQSLGVALEDRHPFQARLVEMVGEVLSGI